MASKIREVYQGKLILPNLWKIRELGMYALVMPGAPKADEDERSSAYPSGLPGERELREKSTFSTPPQ